MTNVKRLALLASAACLLLAFAAGTASANRGLAIRPGGPIFAEGPVRLNESLRVANIECELHLEGVLKGGVPKIARLPEGELGMLTRDEFRECEVMRLPVTVEGLVEPGTPSPIVYNSFLGVLPAITGVLMISLGVGLQITIGATRCLYRGNVPLLIWKSPGEALFNRKTFLANTLRYVRGNCERESTLELEGTMIIRPGQMITLM
jgi:hypothetical protein